MMWEAYKTKEEFKDNCPCWYQILDFVKSIEDTDTRWYFDICYNHHPERRYSTIFKSYSTEEYKDYVLSVEARFNDELRKYEFRIVKKVDNLE